MRGPLVTSRFAEIALVVVLLSPAVVWAASARPDSLVYVLSSPSSAFEWGCFGRCMCPVLIDSPLSGAFTMTPAGSDPFFAKFDVSSVNWKTPGVQGAIGITGSGAYRIGGEFALLEQLTLDLSFDGGPVQHFDSGLVPPVEPFPAIVTRVSLHAEFCLDSVLAMDARPLEVAAAGAPPAPVIGVAPNPFGEWTRIAFTLARPGLVSLGVFDLTGRRVRSIAAREWMGAGTHARTWDGLLESGGSAPAGMYFLRLETLSGGATRAAVKLR